LDEEDESAQRQKEKGKCTFSIPALEESGQVLLFLSYY
jgi:hypothetical protein